MCLMVTGSAFIWPHYVQDSILKSLYALELGSQWKSHVGAAEGAGPDCLVCVGGIQVPLAELPCNSLSFSHCLEEQNSVLLEYKADITSSPSNV